MYCFTCKMLSPPCSVYCRNCEGGKSFNAQICHNGHRCSVETVTCPQCGNGEFSESVTGIPTDWIAKLASVGLLVALWKASLAHYDLFLPVFGRVAAYTFGVLTNSDANALQRMLETAFLITVMSWILGLFIWFLPGQGGVVGRFLRGIPVRIALFALKVAPRLLTRLLMVVLALAGLHGGKGNAHPPKPQNGKGG